jgi:hypothetical protein
MKLFITALLLAIGFGCMAQRNQFVRVFDLQGKKFYKGYVIGITDTSLIFKNSIEIYATDIGMIKTKRSAGHNVGLGIPIGIAASYGTGSIVGGWNGLGIFLISPLTGAIGGFVSIAFKNPQTFEINGNLENWSRFKNEFQK